MRQSTLLYPSLEVDGNGAGVVSQAGTVALLRTAEAVGLDRVLSQVLAPWRKPLAMHDPGKIVLDLAVAVAIGGDCAADVGMLRCEPGVFGPVASDPAVSRLIATLAGDARKALPRWLLPGPLRGRRHGGKPVSMRPIMRSPQRTR